MSYVDEYGYATAEFGALMFGLAEFYRIKLTEVQIVAYARALSDLPIESVSRACEIVVKEAKFFPAVAELRSAIFGSVEDAALVAWSSFGRAASDVGAWSSLDVDDAVAAAALRTTFGSWPNFCEAAVEGPGFTVKRSEFLAAYRIARRSTPPTSAPVRLFGLCEQSGQRPKELGNVTWVGRLKASGEIAHARDVAALPAASETKQIGEGDAS